MIAPPHKVYGLSMRNLHVNRNEKHQVQRAVGNPMLGVVFVHVVHMWRVMQSETENQALSVDFYSGSFGLVFRGL